MNAQEISEGNELVAKYMGLTYGKSGSVDGEHWRGAALIGYCWASTEELKYHSDWNWLIPVAKKIKTQFDFDYKEATKDAPKGITYAYPDGDYWLEIRKALIYMDIEKLWIAVIGYIKKFNAKTLSI